MDEQAAIVKFDEACEELAMAGLAHIAGTLRLTLANELGALREKEEADRRQGEG
jgi:hypothetical protein